MLNSRDGTAALLVEHGGRLMLSERATATKLCDAASSSDHNLVRSYLRAGANPDAADYDRRTALMLAAAGGESSHPQLVRRA